MAIYTSHYFHKRNDNSLNRYFALLGANDPVPFYLGKADRSSYLKEIDNQKNPEHNEIDLVPSYGDNGFFYLRELLLKSDLDHYYPMDNAVDLINQGYDTFGRMRNNFIWHRTTNGNLTEFLKRRYRYARNLYCDRQDRRWKMFDGRQDYWRLAGFVFSTISIIPCIAISIRGFLKVRDWAWFWHWPVCLGFLIIYGLLACRNLLWHQSLFQVTAGRKALKPV